MKIKYFVVQLVVVNRLIGIILLAFIFTLFQNNVFAKDSQEEEPSVQKFIIELPENPLEIRQQDDIDENVQIDDLGAEECDNLDETDAELPENNNEIQSDLPEQDIKPPIEPQENVESENIFLNDIDLDKNTGVKIYENTLIGKMIERDIIRTDVPSYLLKEELTFQPEKGPVSKIQYYGAYSGHLSSYWSGKNYDTSYDFGFIQLGAIGKIRGTKTNFKVVVNPKGIHGLNYMQSFFADAYLINDSIPHHKVVAGYSRNQIGKEGGSSSYILPFVMRSQISRNFGSTRALGVRLIGDYDLVDYSMAFNSSDRYFREWFAGPEFTGWVDLKPLGKTDGRYGQLIVGGGLNAGKNNTSYTVGSLYLGYKYKKLWSSFEFAAADGYNGSYVVDKKAAGFYGTVGYKIHPRLQIIGRYDQFDPDRDASGDTKREYTAGINYFIKGQALRIMLNYIFCRNQNTADSHRLLIGTQVLL